MATGFNVTGLQDYTSKATELLRSGILFSESFSKYNVQSGIKNIEPLNILSTNPVLQAGACSLASSGATTLTTRNIEVASHNYHLEWCLEDLQKKNLQLVPGSQNDAFDSSFEAVLTADIIENIKKQQEVEIFVGSKTSGDLIDGIYTLVAASSAQTTISTTATPTAANIEAIIAEVMAAVTDDMWGRNELVVINMSIANYNLFKAQLIKVKTPYNETIANAGIFEMDVPGYSGQAVIRAQSGLKGKAYIMAYCDSNIYLGVDEVNEVSSFKYVFDEVTDLTHGKAKYKLGVQVAFPAEVVSNF